DFAILCYPVIRLDAPYGHGGSRRNLLGDNPDPKLLASLCNDTQVTRRTPPTFLFHTREDRAVPVENSELYYQALQKAAVPSKLLVRQKGQHGVGLASRIPELKDWPDQLARWLTDGKFLPGPSDR
ncbi:MAG: prolyl oligopeptidase family serine peptidase, partial [Gemmataceae bacterium]